MRKLLLSLLVLVVLTGCATEPTDQAANSTFFGRLSARFQFGTTEENIVNKLFIDNYLVTVDGEVLMDKPAYFKVTVDTFGAAKIPAPTAVSVNACRYTDLDKYNWNKPANCSDNASELTVVALDAVQQSDNVYLAEGFEWQTSTNWYAEVILETDWVESGTVVAPFDVYVYENRPPTTTTFEFVNLLLPFAVIAVFIGILTLFKGKLQIPVAQLQEVSS